MKRVGIMLTALAVLAAGVLYSPPAMACGMSDPCPSALVAPTN